jgi:hypothetical protein
MCTARLPLKTHGWQTESCVGSKRCGAVLGFVQDLALEDTILDPTIAAVEASIRVIQSHASRVSPFPNNCHHKSSRNNEGMKHRCHSTSGICGGSFSDCTIYFGIRCVKRRWQGVWQPEA